MIINPYQVGGSAFSCASPIQGVTTDYGTAIENIERIIKRGKTALMCSEKDHNRCHRGFIFETLSSRGYPVIQVKYEKNKVVSKQVSLTYSDE